MAQLPPIGYDDPSIIPVKIILNTISQLENDLLNKRISNVVEKEFRVIVRAAEDLGSYSIQKEVHDIIEAYQSYSQSKDESELHRMLEKVKNLKNQLAP